MVWKLSTKLRAAIIILIKMKCVVYCPLLCSMKVTYFQLKGQTEFLLFQIRMRCMTHHQDYKKNLS